MATLNNIVDEIADALNRPFDTLFKERLKIVIKHERSTLIRQSLNKYNNATLFKQRYSVPVIDSTKSDSISSIGSNVKRTTNKIYTPVRFNTRIPFNFVGSEDGVVSYIYTELSELPYISSLPNNALALRYTYRNGYIYLYGGSLLESVSNIAIESPLENPQDMINVETNENYVKGIRYNDDMEFPMPDDLVQDIKIRLLSGELRVIDSKDKVNPTHLDNE